MPTAHATEERFSTVRGEAGALHVSDGGTGGTPIVFLHGLGIDLEAWRAQLEAVRAHRRAVAYDQRGHGRSERPAGGAYSVDGLAADLEAVRRALALERIVLVAHSMSGAVATAYAAAHADRVVGIVYVDAAGDFGGIPVERRQAEVAKQARYTIDQWKAEWDEMLGANARPSTRSRVLAAMDRVETRAFAALEADMLFAPSKQRAAKYPGPRWAIDAGAPGAATSATSAAALDPTTHRVAIAGVSHWLMMDDPIAFNRALEGALAALP